MPLRCLDPECEGELNKIIDSRDAAVGNASQLRSIFSRVKAWMGNTDGFRWRLRECASCGKRWSTIEEMLGPEFGTGMANATAKKENKKTPNIAELDIPSQPRVKPILSVAEEESSSGILTANAIGQNMNFSGEACVRCGGFMTVRTGTCIKCLSCYHDTGCG